MNDMFKKVNGRFPPSLLPCHTILTLVTTAREKLIGWYHTGPKLRASDLEINQVIKRYTNKPVMVIVDVRPDSERGAGGIPTDAYFAVEEIKDVSPPQLRHFPQPTHTINLTGWHSYAKDFYARPLIDRSGRSGRNRCRTSPARYQIPFSRHPLIPRFLPTLLPIRSPLPTPRNQSLSRSSSRRNSPRESSNHLQPTRYI